LLSKGWKHTKIKAKLSVSFGNLGKTFAMFSGIPDRSRAPKAERLHLESGKTYVKSAPTANGRNVWPHRPIFPSDLSRPNISSEFDQNQIFL